MKNIWIRAAIGILAAGMLGWALLPTVLFSIFHYGTAVLIIVFGTVLLLALFWEKFCLLLRRIAQIRGGRIGLWTGALLLSGVLVGAVAGITAMAVASDREAPNGTKTVIVLGCQTYSYQPSPMLRDRLQTALRYLKEEPDAVVIVSGGQGGNETVSEAECMRAWLTERGIEPQRILKEECSASTEENLRESARVMRENGLGTQAWIVTDWWHQLRAIKWAEENGLQVGTRSCATWWILLPSFAARELCAWVRLILLGY